MPTHEEYMKAALEAAKKGDLPYGAILVKNGKIKTTAYNTAQRDNDPTAHAEINALRHQIHLLGQYEPEILNGYSLYTTCEPCPMCAAACAWTGISEIVFGASIADLIGAGQPQISVPCETITNQSFQSIKVTSSILAPECLALFQ
ncbi:MAG: nucleoside deaminase [Jaaginema sp. PMC 1079.18]|nr:nucleoside deaminase [Jaaginema sp. PMC 1080.18]MEC4849821.1 nucleoside deaminase [Jaaginema sp. PMC 1079.18]MEC4865265.1 nucleoside deaminase [Jaaginema sp. PMC 1078.18]